MPLQALSKFPGPYFGGKRQAAPLVWTLLGDVAHYAEPFCGSGAVLLERPHLANRPYHSETVNDADGFLVNAMRCLAWSPQATAEAASWPVSEADLMARQLWLRQWAAQKPLELLFADPTWHDPLAGGWWLWGLSCWIGGGWCYAEGPWSIDPDTGRIRRLTTAERGENLGVKRHLPHISDNGQGVHHAGTRAPGVWRQRPHISDNGQGVHRAGTRAPGVKRHLPHISDNGRGVHHAGTRALGVQAVAPYQSDLASWEALVEEDYRQGQQYHPRTMPELRRWFAALSARLRHVRILHGEYRRLLTTGALKTLVIRQKTGHAGIFLDPPYSATERDPELYASDGQAPHRDIPAEVRAWCLTHGPDPDYRIVLAGFAGEGHEVLEDHGWRAYSWFEAGHLRGGYGNGNANGHQQHRERLWASPHCLHPAATDTQQLALWSAEES